MPYHSTHHHFPLENKYSQLLAAQIVLLVLPTLVRGEMAAVLTSSSLVSLVVILTLRTFEIRFPTLFPLIMGTLALGLLEVILIAFEINYRHFSLIINGFHFIVTIIAIFSVLQRIFRLNVITGDSIRGGICVYFLAGYLFFFVYKIILDYQPDSFSYPAYLHGLKFSSLLYFSFTTLTSVGYGDITPISAFAMAISNLEAIFGQMYSAIVMARLVSQYLNSRSAKSS